MPSTQLPGCERFQVCRATTPAPRGGCGAGGQGAWTQLPGMRLLGAGRECSAGAAEPGVAEPRMPGCLPAGPFQCTGRLCEPELPPAPHQPGGNESSGGFTPSPCNVCQGRRSTGGLQPPSSAHVSLGLGGWSQSPESCAARGVALGALSLPICRRNLHRSSWDEARSAPQGAVLTPCSVIRSDQHDSAPVRVNLFP